MTDVALEVKEISKSFGRIEALKRVSFSVKRGEVVGLLGDNGAGKSTLLNILSGVFPPDSGEILIFGEKVKLKSPLHARKLGIETVYQKQALAINQSIARNIFMGREITNSLGVLNLRKANEISMHILRDEIGLENVISAEQKVGTLSGGERASVAIARVMYFKPRIALFDEPTVALSLVEVQRLLDFVKDLKTKGVACVFVDHNIREVYEVADRFVLLDGGQKVGEYSKDEIGLEELMEEMIQAKSKRKGQGKEE